MHRQIQRVFIFGDIRLVRRDKKGKLLEVEKVLQYCLKRFVDLKLFQADLIPGRVTDYGKDTENEAQKERR